MIIKKRKDKSDFNKKGQVTIFVIIAVLVVVAGVLVYLFLPEFSISQKDDLENPQDYIKNCISDKTKEVINKVSLQGGSLNPEAYYLHGGSEVEYLCYSNEYYDLCSVQRPFLEEHIEEEIKSGISQKTESCFSSLKQEYQNKGYNAEIVSGEINADVLPERVFIDLNRTIYINKEGNSETHKNFEINLGSKLKKMIGVAQNIIEWESSVGTAEPSFYMNQHHDLIVNKKPQGDETIIYIIEDNAEENKFKFASRSLAFPPGYGVPPSNVMPEQNE